MKFPVFQIDAFASEVFAGNPAVVCCLDEWRDDAVLGAIAAEHNISTTAFLVDGGDGIEIRYFTPTGEMALVGHASLAAAAVVLTRLRPGEASVRLQRRRGPLTVSRAADGLFAIELPANPPRACDVPAGIADALGTTFETILANDLQYFVIVEDEATVASLAPDMERLMRLDRDVIVSAAGGSADFVSRAFAPREGLPEDPVCGSAHLSLVPYWSARLARTSHHALQLSPRGGELFCTLADGHVRLAGRCALYLEGTIRIADGAIASG